MHEQWRRDLGTVARDDRTAMVGDLVVAVLLAATSVVAALSGARPFGSPPALGVGLALASTTPVAWRRRWPLPVAAVLLVTQGLCLLAAAPREGALQPFLAVVLAAYTVGSRVEGRYWLVAPAALGVLALPVFALGVADRQSIGNEVTSYVWLVATWLVGRVVRRMRTKTQELETANTALAEHRERAAEVAAVRERGRIAREVHDVIAHNVSMMVVQAAAAARVLRAEEPEVRAALETIAETGRQTVEEMRGLLGILRSDTDDPAQLTPQPGLGDVGALTAGLTRAGIAVSWHVEGDPTPLPRGLDLSAYRIVQEALTNAVKHAPGARIEVSVRYLPESLELDVTDHGGTRSDAASSGGHGLVGMRERASMFGGHVTTTSREDGFRLLARLPLPAGVTA